MPLQPLSRSAQSVDHHVRFSICMIETKKVGQRICRASISEILECCDQRDEILDACFRISQVRKKQRHGATLLEADGRESKRSDGWGVGPFEKRGVAFKCS